MFHSHLNTDFISLFCVILKKERETKIELDISVRIVKRSFNLVLIQKFQIL